MRVYIASDFHLPFSPETEEEAQRGNIALSFLSEINGKADVLILNGDVFDLWYDWKSSIIKGYFPVLKKLADLSESGCRLIFIAGNHDFWFNDFFSHYLKCEVFTESFQETIDGQRLFVAHGDRFTSNDSRYQFFRLLVRHPLTRTIFSLLHPELALGFGRMMSRTSRKRSSSTTKSDERRNTGLMEYAKKISAGYDLIIMGHAHAPVVIDFHNSMYINSGDWVTHFSYVVIDDGKPELCYFKDDILE